MAAGSAADVPVQTQAAGGSFTDWFHGLPGSILSSPLDAFAVSVILAAIVVVALVVRR
ncbi:hypothetical protein O3S80_07050 [Streptomyces sp. Lzd4kr]|nr:hypothetical protein [Streptomyces sp. Lzd4kr]